MDNSSVGSTSSLSSIMTDASTLKLTQLDLQLLDLSGNASGEDDKHLGKGKRYPEQTKRMLAPANSSNSAQGEGEGRQEIEKEEQEEGETIAMATLYNKIGKHAYQAVKFKNMKVLHAVKKEKINTKKFHEILLDLHIMDDLTDEEVDLLGKRYRIAKTNTGVHFDKFLKDFKRLGKSLYEKNMRNKIRWKSTTRKINLLGGLPDNGVVLEDLSTTLTIGRLPIVDKYLPNTELSNRGHVTKFTNPQGVTASVHRTTYGRTPSEIPIAAAAAAYSAYFAGIESPVVSARDPPDDEPHESDQSGQEAVGGSVPMLKRELKSLQLALETAAEIDSLRGRGPPIVDRATTILTPKTKEAAIKIVNHMSGHADNKKVMSARAKKRGAVMLNSIQGTMQPDYWKSWNFGLSSDDDACVSSFVDDPLDRLVTSSPYKTTLPPIEDSQNYRSPVGGLDPLFASATPAFCFDIDKLDELKESDFEVIDSDDEEAMERKRFEEEAALMDSEAAAALAMIEEEEKREAEREEMEERKRLDAMTEHEKAYDCVYRGNYSDGIDKLSTLLEMYERNRSVKREKDRAAIPRGTPTDDVLFREIAEVYIMLGEYASASVLIDKFFTKLRMKTIFVDGSIKLEDLKKLLVICTWHVHLYHMTNARPLLEKAICVCEDLSPHYTLHLEAADYLVVQIELYILKLRMLTKLGAYEAALSISEQVSILIAKLVPFKSEELERERAEEEMEEREEDKRKRRLQEEHHDAQHNPQFSMKSIAARKEEAAQKRKKEKQRLKERREKKKQRRERDRERIKKQRVYDKLVASHKAAEGALLCLVGKLKLSIEACALALERSKTLYGKFVDKEVVEDENEKKLESGENNQDKKLERVYDEDSKAHPQIAASFRLLGVVMTMSADYTKADECFIYAIEHGAFHFGDDHALVATFKLSRIWSKVKCFMDKDIKPDEAEVQEMRDGLNEILKIYSTCFQQLTDNIICEDGSMYPCHPSIGHVLYAWGMLEKQSDNLDAAYSLHVNCYQLRKKSLRKKCLHYLLSSMETCRERAWNTGGAHYYDLCLRSTETRDHFCQHIGNKHAYTCAMNIQHAAQLTTLGYFNEGEAILGPTWDVLKEQVLELSAATEASLNFEAVLHLGENIVSQGRWSEGIKLLSTLVVNSEDLYANNKDSIAFFKRYQRATLICAECLNTSGQFGKALSLITKYELEEPPATLSPSSLISTTVVDLIITKAVSLFGIERVNEGVDTLQSVHEVCIFSDIARVAQIISVTDATVATATATATATTTTIDYNGSRGVDNTKRIELSNNINGDGKFVVEVPNTHPSHTYFLATHADYQRRIGAFHIASDYYEEVLSLRLKHSFDIRSEKIHPDTCISLLQCANIQIEIAGSFREESKRKDRIAPLVLAFNEDLVPMFKNTFGARHAITLYVIGCFGIVVKILGGFRGEQQIKQAINELRKSPHEIPEDHIWMTRLKQYVVV